MITGMNHTGFVVRDIDKSLEFYRDVAGLEVVRTVDRDGGPISELLGYDHVHLTGAILSVGNGHLLELLQYLQPEGEDRHSEERSTLGASHLAFDVDDIEQTYQDLISRGAQKLNPPVEMQPGRKACYLQDPDGNWLELIEVTA